MTGAGEVAAVYGLITGSIAIVRTAMDIYGAVQDQQGIDTKLRKVADKLPTVEELLRTAEAQYNSGTPDEETWLGAEKTLQKCKDNCQAIKDIFTSIFPEAEAGTAKRWWKGALTHSGGKGKKVEDLFTDMYEQLEVLVQSRILVNTELLEGIKATVDELAGGGEGRFHNTGSGMQQNIVQHGLGTMNSVSAASHGNSQAIQIPGGSYVDNQGTQVRGV